MRTISCKLEDLKTMTLHIGYEGENDYTSVRIDAGSVFAQYPEAVPSLKVQPPKGNMYPVIVTRDGDIVIWNVSDSDTASNGNGEIQLTFTENTVVVKSCTGKTLVHRSLKATGPAPDPLIDFIDMAEEVVGEAQDAAEAAEAAAQHAPMIGLDGYWYKWDAETEGYVKTDTKARGEDGANGVGITSVEKISTVGLVDTYRINFTNGTNTTYTVTNGQDGSVPIDDTTPAANKVFSSAKVDEELTDVKTAIHGLENDKYEKPSGGIPKTDLASDVQTSIGKADTALQANDVATAVDAWCDENITNPDSPPLDRSLTSSSAATPADIVGELKSAFDSLDYHVRYETEEVIAEKSVSTTSGIKIDSTESGISITIASGTSFRFRASGTNLISKFALYYNEGGSSHRFGTNLLPNTNYDYTAPEAITSLYIYTGGTDVTGTGTLKLIVANVVQNSNSVDKKIADIESVLDEMSVLRGDKWEIDRSTFTTICVHHDNFSRTMTGWEIGMNAGGTDEGNAYDWVTPDTYDDGLRVDNGATFESGTRTYSFSLRKIAESVSDNFMFETNAPTTDHPVLFGFNVTDITNFLRLEIRKNSSGYRMLMNNIVNGAAQPSILNLQVTGVTGKVISIYCVHGIMFFYLDDTLLCSPFVGSLGNYVYLASNKSYNTHFDFVNVFNIVPKTSWNPNRILDDGVSAIPLKTVSANEGNYELQNTTTRWSNYADHMTLHSDDELIHSGRRCEVSIGNMDAFKGNLRHFVISFDVLFPSEYVDTEQGDLFVQTHDRDGTYRGTVPFALYIKNNVININTSSTYAPKDDNTSVIIDLHRFDFAEVELGRWHHFEIEIKERYEERQNPFLRIKIDGITQFEYRKANCYNDLLGTSPQYGIYKNNWGTGVTEFQRYFDNFKIDFI